MARPNAHSRSDIDFDDLEEAPRRARESRTRTVAIIAISVFCSLAFVVILIRGSMPEMTPEQIVQMDGYEGQQPPRYIFNLFSLKQQRQAQQQEKNPVSEGAVQQADSDTVPIAASSVVAVAEPALVPVTDAQEIRIAPVAVTKVSSSGVGNPTRETGKPATLYEKAELTRATNVRFIGRIDAVSKDAVSDQKTVPIEVLPVLTVKGDQSLLRSGPSRQASILKILAKGDTITLFDYEGDWTYVGINDGSSTIGYMHNSLLEAAPAYK